VKTKHLYKFYQGIDEIDIALEDHVPYSLNTYTKQVTNTLHELPAAQIADLCAALDETRHNGAIVYTIGNGGSGSTASHMASDFGFGLRDFIPRFRTKCLCDSMPSILAAANDIGYQRVFRVMLEDIITPGDLLIAFSGSGNSNNILEAVEYAKSKHVLTVGFCGFDGGELKKLCDIPVHVPVNDMQITEDIHLMICHYLVRHYKDFALFGVSAIREV
jgi:D-sedoheptulose 7-phosphate isomerase